MAPRFDLYSLQLFLTVLEQGSIAAAAEREHIAASALSKRMAELERRLGVTLLIRKARGIEPTDAGQSLARGARKLLHQASDLADGIDAIAKGMRGHVRLAANLSSITEFLSEDLRRFLLAHPGVSVDLTEMVSTEVTRAVAENVADIGVYTQADNLFDLRSFPYRRDRLALITPLDHPLSVQARVRFTETLPYDHVGMHRGSAANRLLMRQASELGRTLRLRFQVTSYDALISMVGAGFGVGIMPHKSLDLYTRERIHTAELADAWAVRELKLCVRPDDSYSRAAHKLVEHLRMPAGPDGRLH